MAYSAAITYLHSRLGVLSSITSLASGDVIQITITETECAAASEATPTLGRQCLFYTLRYEVVQASGTGTTINPRFGPATNPDGMGGVLMLSGGAAAPPKSVDTGGARVTTDTSGRLFHRTVPNAGADNTYTVKIWAKVV